MNVSIWYLFWILLVSLIVFLLSAVYSNDTIFKNKIYHKTPIDILLLVALIINIGIQLYVLYEIFIISKSIFKTKNIDIDSNILVFDPRTIIMVFSLAVASVALLATVANNRRSSENNIDIHHTNLLLKMIENNYKLITDGDLEDIFSNTLLPNIQSKISKNQLKFNYILKYSVTNAEDILNNKNFFNEFTKEINLLKSNNSLKCTNETLRIIKGIAKYKEDSIRRLFLAYIKNEHSSWFMKLQESERQKAFDENVFKSLQRISSLKSLITFWSEYINDKDVNEIAFLLKSEYTQEMLFEEINAIYDKNYSEIGHFFRHSNRVVKLINKYYLNDIEKRKEFLGILRSYYSEETLLAVYYNCTFTNKGRGFGVHLYKSDFFGDNIDLDENGILHFRTDRLLLENIDISILRDIYMSYGEQSNILSLPTKDEFSKKIKDKVLPLENPQ